MKTPIGAVIVMGAIMAGCRSMPATVELVPTTGKTTATSTTSDQITKPQQANIPPTQPMSQTAEHPTLSVVDVDLSDLDGLLADLDNVLGTLEDNMQEGEEQ